MSLSLECPANPHLSYMGMCALGASGLGFNIHGRLTSYIVKNDGAVVTISGNAENIQDDLQPHIKTFYSGDYYSERMKLNASVTRLTPRSDIIFDAIPLNAASTWRDYPGPFPTAQKRNLLVEWDGDADTERYRIYHSLEVTHADVKISASRSANSVITVTNDTGTLAEITVTGIDGPIGPEGNYTVTIYHLTEDGDIYMTILDNVEATLTDTITWDGSQVSFGRGLTMVLSEPWPDVGITTFTVLSEPDRSYLLRNPTDATHYFKVRACRDTDGTYAETAWEEKTIANPPNPVSNIDVDFVSETSVNFLFRMPSDVDIAGFYLYLGEYWKTGNSVPHWYPKITAAAAPSADITATVGGLTAGRKYWFYIRAFDDKGLDDETTNVASFFLSTTAVSYGDIEQPYDISAEATALATVTITVTTNKEESSLFVYWNNGTGPIDWTTPYDTLLSSERTDEFGNEYGTYSETYTPLGAGTYLFGARCAVGGANDGNTEIYDDVTVFDTALSAPTGLTITEVPSDG